ncbi:MAG TPA: hypothetical protein VMT67_14365 [Terriglobales bacterium]|nr:hypothetical protein [Terriglobales bacterium]
MPIAFILAILIRMITAIHGARAFRQRQAMLKSQCNECAYAHIQFGACGRRAISCTFGGGIRLVKLDVLYCTEYRPRLAPSRPPVGFVREIAPAG